MPIRIKWFYPLVSLSILLVRCNGTTATTPSPPTASLSEIQGEVEIKQAYQDEFTPAAEEMILEVQGTVRTGDTGRARLNLCSGTFIRLAPLTAFTLESNEPEFSSLLTRLKMETGQIWIILRGGRLDVETPSGMASVRGSFLSVWIDPNTGDVHMACLEGTCQAENPAASIDLHTGEGCLLPAWDPMTNIPPPPPQLTHLTQNDIDQFLLNNPEAQEVLPAVIATASALPTLTPTPTLTPGVLLPPVGGCFGLLLPINGASLPETGGVVFTWGSQPGAFSYVLTLITPAGASLSFSSASPGIVRYMESLPAGGTYTWKITALDGQNSPICSAGPFSFTKPATSPTLLPLPTQATMDKWGYVVVGNTEFWNPSGPNGTIPACQNTYSINASDPDGISYIKVYYDVYNSTGSLTTSGYKVLGYAGGTSFTSSFSIPASATDDVYWKFVAGDPYGSYQYPTTYQYSGSLSCP